MKAKSTNKFLIDFPERLEGEELVELMANNTSPAIYKNEPNGVRKTKLELWQKEWFYIHDNIQPLYDNFYSALYSAFDSRDDKYLIKMLNVTREWYEKAEVKGYVPPIMKDFNVDGFSIIGVSGVGKTHCTRTILRKCFNQLILRENFVQITYVITNCVDIGSLKDLLIKFLVEVDSLIGSTYLSDYVTNKNSTEMLQPVIANCAVRAGIGMWIVDECHHLKSVPFRSAEQIINFLKNISAVIGMPIVFIGTPEVKSILGGNFQIGRRAEGDGSIFWERFVYDNQNCEGDKCDHPKDKKKCKCVQNSEWKNLVKAVWKRQVLRQPGALTKTIVNAYYQTTKGVMKRLLSVHKRAQLIALNMGEETLTPEIILETEKFFKLTNPILKTLDSNDRHLRGLYPDVSMEVFDIIETVSKRKITDEEFVDVVMNGHFTEEEIQMIFNAFVSRIKPSKTDGNKPVTESDFDQTNTDSQSKQAKNKNHSSSGEILDKVKQVKNKEDLYNALKESGVIGLPVTESKE
jgi:AAA domain